MSLNLQLVMLKNIYRHNNNALSTSHNNAMQWIVFDLDLYWDLAPPPA